MISVDTEALPARDHAVRMDPEARSFHLIRTSSMIFICVNKTRDVNYSLAQPDAKHKGEGRVSPENRCQLPMMFHSVLYSSTTSIGFATWASIPAASASFLSVSKALAVTARIFVCARPSDSARMARVAS